MASVSMRHRVYEIIEPGIKRDSMALWFERASILIILASVAGAVGSTVPSLNAWIINDLSGVEIAFGLFFLCEYAARVWTAPEHPVFGGERGHGLVAYIVTPLMLLDVAGCLPLLVLITRPQATSLILILQVLRFFRLARYSP